MGWFSDITKSLTSSLPGMGGGGGETTASSTQSTVNTTEINIDLKPMSEILAQSQEQVAETLAQSQEQVALTDKETAIIDLLNADKDREQGLQFMKQFDGYLEHAKNGFFIFCVFAAFVYLSKNSKKGGKN